MTTYELIAVKRDWVPEWLWHALCFLSNNRVTAMHRWLCTEPKGQETE